MAQSILVVGGNGFIGSAVCRAALARGMRVTSISSSGIPYRTSKGHTPPWVSKIEWRKADALHPNTYAELLPAVDGVVHTIGTLLEDGSYKAALAKGDLSTLFAAFRDVNGDRNPLERKDAAATRGSYEILNRDSALRVCEAFLASSSGNSNHTPGTDKVRPFVYLSAEDISRPIVPARYIETKREAELQLNEMLHDHPGYRGVFVRPSLVYHAHQRPLASPLAALIDFSASLHARAPKGVPTPSSVLRTVASVFSPSSSSEPQSSEPPFPSSPPTHTRPFKTPSMLHAMANMLTIPPIHVDHVAEAICIALDLQRTDVKGVLGVKEMRELIGWTKES